MPPSITIYELYGVSFGADFGYDFNHAGKTHILLFDCQRPVKEDYAATGSFDSESITSPIISSLKNAYTDDTKLFVHVIVSI